MTGGAGGLQIESDPGKASEVEVRFVPEGETRTRVELEHRHLDRHGEGWESLRAGIAGDRGGPLYLSRYRRLAGHGLFRRGECLTRAPLPAAGERQEARYERETPEFDRAIAFIDATFAVALTLLITTLDVPDPPSSFASLSAFTDAAGAQLLAFAIAFIVIAAYWLAHHRMVAEFAALDRPTLVANLGLIAAIVLLPFTTRSVGDPDVADLALPTALMAVNVAVVSLLHLLVWVIAARRGLLDHTPAAGELRGKVIDGLVAPAVFLTSVPIAYLVSPGIARLWWLVLIALNPAVGIWTARARGSRSAG